MKRTCQALTRNGAPCKAPAVDGGSFCFLHADPARASRLGRAGGRKNRRSHIDLQIPDQVDAAALRDLELQALRAIVSGEMEYRVAAAFFTGCNSVQRLLPLIDAAELGRKIGELEEKVAEYERQVTTAPSSNPGDSELHHGREDANTQGNAQKNDENTSITPQPRRPQNCEPNPSSTTEQYTDSTSDSSPENIQLDSDEQAYNPEEDDGEHEN